MYCRFLHELPAAERDGSQLGGDHGSGLGLSDTDADVGDELHEHPNSRPVGGCTHNDDDVVAKTKAGQDAKELAAVAAAVQPAASGSAAAETSSKPPTAAAAVALQQSPTRKVPWPCLRHTNW